MRKVLRSLSDAQICMPLHPAVEARCRAVISTSSNEELRKTAERLIANGGRRRRNGGPPAVQPPAAADPGPAGPAQSWTCPSCTLVNDKSAAVCAACTTRRSTSSSTTWACAACMTENAESAARCKTCEQPRARAAPKRRRDAPAAPEWDDDEADDFAA